MAFLLYLIGDLEKIQYFSASQLIHAIAVLLWMAVLHALKPVGALIQMDAKHAVHAPRPVAFCGVQLPLHKGHAHLCFLHNLPVNRTKWEACLLQIGQYILISPERKGPGDRILRVKNVAAILVPIRFSLHSFLCQGPHHRLKAVGLVEGFEGGLSSSHRSTGR